MQQQNEITSFLLIGQSNMAGRGELSEGDRISDPRCFMLRVGRWVRLEEPINPDRPIFEGEFHSGASLAASFAYRYATIFDRRVGLIPAADGGTRIAEWMPGGILFDHAVFMAKLAMRTSRLGGILWHQGESDCNAQDFPLYRERFLTAIPALRRALNAEGLPFIFGEISEQITPRWGRLDYPSKMNALLHELAGELPHARIVSARDLPIKPDGIHFSTPSLRALGERYLDAYLEMTSKP